MNREEKDLLLKDLCAKLPYTINPTNEHSCDIDEIKPYPFPMSNINKEELYEFYCKFVRNEIDFNDFKKYYSENLKYLLI